MRCPKFLVLLKIRNFYENIEKENTSLAFRLKKIDETRNYFFKRNNYFVSKTHKKTCKSLNHIELLLVLASAFTYWVSISVFVADIPAEITSCVAGLKICVIRKKLKKKKKIGLLVK